jgi:hypothetical protein
VIATHLPPEALSASQAVDRFGRAAIVLVKHVALGRQRGRRAGMAKARAIMVISEFRREHGEQRWTTQQERCVHD